MTNRTISPIRWALLGTTMTAIGTAAAAGATHVANQPENALIKLASAENGEAGESGAVKETGEAGESGEAGHEDSAESAADFLADLGFIRGHLMAGYTLYKAGQSELAYTHMKHPGDEIYTDLLPELKERNLPGFADELNELAEAIEHGADVGTVDTAFADLVAVLDSASAAVEDPEKAKLHAIVELTNTAAEEYAEGVVDGKIANLHEYQDAWGFIQIARAYARDLVASSDAGIAKAAATAAEQLDGLEGSFKGIVPPTEIGTDPSDLYVAAARINFATSSVK